MVIKKLLKWWLGSTKRRRGNSQKGFTLLELLVSMLIASIIIVTLLSLVVEMMQVNRRETVLTELQTDLQRALDYMSRDARESVYVYSNHTDLDALTAQIDDLPSGSTPVLAFWRVDPVDVSVLPANCDTGFSTTSDKEICKALKLRQGSYTLVVYVQATNPNGSIWKGASRIIRYELSQYSDVATLTQRDGYADPMGVDNARVGFGGWQATATPTKGTSAVLTDQLDAPDTNLTNIGYTLDSCPSDVDSSGNPLYQRFPEDINSGGSGTSFGNSFYVCAINGSIPTTGIGETAQNQDIIIYLRGDALNEQPVGFGTALLSNRSKLPALKAQVFIRGVIN